MINIHSKECQVQDWKQHKDECNFIKKRYDQWKEERSIVLPASNALDIKEGPCAICLEETIENPISLPCGHEFCYECITEYQCSPNSDNPWSCPYCSGEIPNVVDKSADRTKIYIGRAIHSPKGSEKQKKYAKLALAEYQANEKVFNVQVEDNAENAIGGMFIKSVIVDMAGQPE